MTKTQAIETFRKGDAVFAISDAGRALVGKFQEQLSGIAEHRATIELEDKTLIELDLETVEPLN